ncbi:L-arabinose isomerase, partial [Klebsiella pneumoniae]
DKVSAQMQFGYSVNGYGVGDLVKHIRETTDRDVDRLVAEYESAYTISPKLRQNGAMRQSLREAARIELGLRSFLNGGFKGFTTTFED